MGSVYNQVVKVLDNIKDNERIQIKLSSQNNISEILLCLEKLFSEYKIDGYSSEFNDGGYTVTITPRRILKYLKIKIEMIPSKDLI